MKTLLLLTLSIANLALVAPAQEQVLGIDSYLESVRSDLRSDKVALIAQVMNFNDPDAKAFWPVYRKYQADMSTLNDRRVELMRTYLEKGPALTDADAKQLADNAMEFESELAAQHKKYMADLRKAGLSQVTVIRLLQIEHRFDLLVDLKITSQLPPLPTQAAAQPVQ